MTGIKKMLMHFTVVFLTLTPTAWADGEGEKEVLAQLIHELDSLTPLIEKGKSQADQDARIKFLFDLLALDISRVKFGIQEHISAPRTQPRRFPPLKGDYRN